MVQFDWSYHLRLENWIIYCLLLAIDDATWEILKMYLTSWESLAEIEAFWKEYFEEFGKPEIIYLDCHATYKVNHEQDQFDKEMLTRFQIAMQKLWIQIIYSKTPEGKWRVERCFQTLQDRLIKKFRINNINTLEEANLYIKHTYIPEHNQKFWKIPKEKWNAHIESTEEEKHNFYWYFAKETNRKLKKDGTIQYNKVIYQLEKRQNLYNWTTITVKENSLWEIDIYSWKNSLNYHKVIEKVP